MLSTLDYQSNPKSYQIPCKHGSLLSKCFADCPLASRKGSESEAGGLDIQCLEVRVQLQHLRVISSLTAWVCGVKKSLDLF